MTNPKFVICINNSGYEVSLELRKLYQLMPDEVAAEATIRLADGTVLNAEIHWYEAHGIGKREFKIKQYLE